MGELTVMLVDWHSTFTIDNEAHKHLYYQGYFDAMRQYSYEIDYDDAEAEAAHERRLQEITEYMR